MHDESLGFDPAEPRCPGGPKDVTVTTDWGTITLHLKDDSEHDFNLSDVIGALVTPALLGSGYDPASVRKYVTEVYW